MVRWIFAGLLLAHGWVHLMVWGLIPSIQPQGTNPAHSLLLGEQRAVASTLVVATALFFAVAAVGLALQTSWWGPATLIAAAASLLVVALFPSAIANVWIVAPLAINIGLFAGIVWGSWPSSSALAG
jgi:hypothetical protein